MIVRNRFTKEWEFPTSKMNFGQTFFRAKQNLFNVIAAGDDTTQDENAAAIVQGTSTATSWKVKYFNQTPIAATIRELTDAEKQEKINH